MLVLGSNKLFNINISCSKLAGIEMKTRYCINADRKHRKSQHYLQDNGVPLMLSKRDMTTQLPISQDAHKDMISAYFSQSPQKNALFMLV